MCEVKIESTLTDQPELKEPYRSLEHQLKTAEFGMWLFLISEILLFGALFLSFLVYRYMYPLAFQEASGHLSVMWGSVNTGVLLTSSLTMAIVVASSQLQDWKRARTSAALTLVLGVIFLAIKAHEYQMEIGEHLFPGPSFDASHFTQPSSQLFFLLYFLTTSLHGLHLTIGIFWMLSLLYRMRTQPNRLQHTIEITGLYWHFIDLVWIFLYPLLYLIGRPHG